MTATPETIQDQSKPKKFDVGEIHPLEQMFQLGYLESGNITIYKDDNTEFVVKFRTLTPTELREVYEESGKFETMLGQILTERLETLARATVLINNRPLILTEKDRQDFFDREKKNPSPLEQARIIFLEKIRSTNIIDAMYEAYKEFSDEIANKFEDIKKKLKNPTPSNSTSP